MPGWVRAALWSPVPTWAPVYAGKGRVRAQAVEAASLEAGAHSYTVRRVEVHIPLSVAVLVGDEVQVTAAADPLLVGARLRVVSIPRQSMATALRLAVEEVQV